MRLGPVLVAAGGGALLLLWRSNAFASDTDNDQTGETVDPSSPEAQPQSIPPPAPHKGRALNDKVTPPSLGTRAVEVLLRDVGAKEVPKGSNRGPVVDKIILGVYKDGAKLLGKPWCGRAARYAYEKAAQELGLPPPFAGLKNTLASVAEWKKVMKDFQISEPKVGAAALLSRGGGKSHATIVSRLEGGKVFTVEGNHGDAVAVVKRKPGDFHTFLDVEAFVRSRQSPLVSGYVLGTDVLAGCA